MSLYCNNNYSIVRKCEVYLMSLFFGGNHMTTTLKHCSCSSSSNHRPITISTTRLQPLVQQCSSRLLSTKLTTAEAPTSTDSTTNNNNNNQKKSQQQRRQRQQLKWNAEAQRRFFDNAAEQLGIKSPEDWYNVSMSQIRQLGGKSLMINHHGNSLYRALSAVYPDHEWLPWRFAHAPRGFWSTTATTTTTTTNNNGNNNGDDTCDAGSGGSGGGGVCSLATHRRFMDWAAAHRLGVKHPEDWYKVTAEQIRSAGGDGMLHHYGGSLQKALAAVYPDREWLPWRFAHVPRAFWKQPANQRRFLDWAAAQMSLRSMEDWYQVPVSRVHELGGGGLLSNHHSGSLQRALAAAYPEYAWEPWRFQRVSPASIMDIITNNNTNNNNNNDDNDASQLQRYIEALAREAQVRHLDDWYRVSLEHLRRCSKKVGGIGSFAAIVEQRGGGLYAVLRKLYPQHEWREEKFFAQRSRSKKSTQRWLFVLLQRKLFPNQEVFEEYQCPGLHFSNSNEAMTLDVCIPALSLAFEYQGLQHYKDVHGFGGNPSPARTRDAEKRDACARAGLTLITVPYWWDRSAESLAASIREVRPDLRLSLFSNEEEEEVLLKQQQQQQQTTTIMTMTTAAAAAPPPPPTMTTTK